MNQIYTINNDKGEKLAIFTFFDPRNRSQEVTDWHKKTHEYLDIPINYIEIDYRTINHGGAMEWCIKALSNKIDYFMFLDNDALILKKEVLNVIFDKLRDGRTVFGGCQNSNHININPTHPFIQPSTFCISTKLYNALGQPHLADCIKRSDTCEEVTWLCQEKGFNVCMVWPTSYSELTDEEVKSSGNPKKWKLTEELSYGLGTNYGDLFFHAGMQSLPRSKEIFINKCNSILEGYNIENDKDKKML